MWNICSSETFFESLNPETVERATNKLTHRGPDDFGYAFVSKTRADMWKNDRPQEMPDPGVALGHRRLSIIDLSSAGRQPFVSSDGRYWMVYNGEVYNYRELRTDLQRAGHVFRTSTDTEVVLIAFATWGPRCFERFNGMWALAIWDREEERLVLSRDRFGIKPLVMARVGQDIVVASEPKALFEIEGVSRAPNMESALGYVHSVRGPVRGETFFQEITELMPGTYAIAGSGRLTHHAYWQLPEPDSAVIKSANEAIERLNELFDDAVHLRLRSDVSVGTMVSGGLDSTSVIQAMNAQLRANDAEARRALGETLQGFHATFPDLPIDETERVNALRRMLDLEVNLVEPVREEAIFELFERSMFHMEEPFVNSVPIVHSLLMAKAREVGVKVVLNGHGADELFGGYPQYHQLAASDYLRHGQLATAYQQLAGMCEMLGISMSEALKRALGPVLPYRLFKWLRRNKHAGKPQREVFRRHIMSRNVPGRTALDAILRRDFQHNILPKWLHLEDRISMSQSIEARLPFLDYRIVDFAFRLDQRLKINSGRTKQILRQAMAQKLPPEIVQEKRKFHFSGPDALWLDGTLKPTVRKLFFDREPVVNDFLVTSNLREEFEEFWRGKRDQTRFLWTVFATEYWLQNYC